MTKVTGIYPEYYILKVNNFNDVAKDTPDEWNYFLKHSVIKDEFKAKGLDKAREVLDRDNLTPEERKAYDYMLDQRSEDRSMVASSKLEGRIEREKLAEKLEREREALEKEREREREERERERDALEREREKLAKENEILLAEIAPLKT